MAACNPVEHGFDRCDLPPGLNGVIEIRVAPPIPAAKRVQRRTEIGPGIAHNGLWIEDDDTIGVGPLIIAGVFNISGLNGLEVLLAAMERDMHPARLLSRTRRRYINVTDLGHAVGSRRCRSRQLPLIKREELAGKRAGVLWIERSVSVLEDNPGLVVITVVDEISFVCPARQTIIHRDLGMAGANRVLIKQIADAGAVQIMQIEPICGIASFGLTIKSL